MPKLRTKIHGKKKEKQLFDARVSSAVDCFSDPKFLFDYQVADFLSVLQEKSLLLFVYGLMLVTIGINPFRLSKLTVVNGDVVNPKIDVYLDRTTGVLSYWIKNNGNDRNKSSKRLDRMSLQLPGFMLQILAKDDSHPFAKLKNEVDRHAREYRRVHGGLTPSACKLSRSFQSLVMPAMEDDLLGSTLTGYVRAGYAAQSHYYRFNNQEVNVRWQKAFRVFIAYLRQHDTATNS